MSKGSNLIGHFMKKFSDHSVEKDFNLFAEIVLAISKMTDAEFEQASKT